MYKKNHICQSTIYHYQISIVITTIQSQLISSFNPNLINLCHYPVRLHQGHNNLLIMQDAIKTKLAVFAVFERLLAGLVAANIKLPGYRRPIIKILVL